MSNNSAPPQYAVWFFVAATFVFAAPTIWFQGSAPLWVTIVTLVGGLVLVALGGIRFGREIRDRRHGRSAE